MNFLNSINSFSRVFTEKLWTQLGVDIDGPGSFFGHSVVMNAEGNIIVVGAPYAGTGGKVIAYSWNGSSWIQLGQEILSEAADDAFGSYLDINSTGDKIIVSAINNDGFQNNGGSVRVYSLVADTWTKVGQDIDGSYNTFFGTAVSINSDGTVIAIGAMESATAGKTKNGTVTVYSLVGNTWTQLGEILAGSSNYDRFGSSIDLNSAGNKIAIGISYSEGAFEGILSSSDNRGDVRIYDLVSNSWVLGSGQSRFTGQYANDQYGSSVSLTPDGNTIAIGAPNSDGVNQNKYFCGQVKVYFWNGSEWDWKGDPIDGDVAYDYSGSAISISSDGNIIAIGASQNDTNGSSSGHVKIYKWNGSMWVKIGQNINGEAAGDLSGFSISLNASGNKIAIGAFQNDGAGANNGHVRIYQF